MGILLNGDFGYDYAPEMYLDFFLIWYLLCFGVMTLISLAVYVLQAVSVYTVAKRRCIRKPWLAWVPVGDLWILGSISDQYRYVSHGQVKNKRKALLVLEILTVVLGIVCSVLFGAFLTQMIAYEDTLFAADHSREMEIVGTLLGMIVAGLAAGCIKIASTVIAYMADYDLYRSCEPKNAVIYLVLSILFSITRPVFLLICCKKDDGMPPRKPETVELPQFVQPEEEPWDRPEEE